MGCIILNLLFFLRVNKYFFINVFIYSYLVVNIQSSIPFVSFLFAVELNKDKHRFIFFEVYPHIFIFYVNYLVEIVEVILTEGFVGKLYEAFIIF